MFKGRTLLIATKHQKEQIISPIFEKELGVRCFVPDHFDTDIFGTFTGETSVDISFDWAFQYYRPGDRFRAQLFNVTTNLQVGANLIDENAKTIEIQANKKISFELLYDKKNSLYKKIKIEQVRKETSNN